MNTNSIIENFKEIVTNKYAQFTGRANKTGYSGDIDPSFR